MCIRDRCYTNPATDLSVPAYASEKEVPALTQFQQQRVEAAAATDPLGDIILFLLNSGLRAGELINLEWINYDKRHQEIHIKESKTKAGIRTLPLTPTLITIIERQPHICDSIFTSTRGTPVTKSVLRKLYLRIRKKTGIDFFTNHVCRHTFATRMIERAADPKAVSILLGHTDVSFTLNRYTHPDNEYLHEQMQLIETLPESNLHVLNKNELQLLLTSLIDVYKRQVLSFDNRWLKQNGLYNPLTKQVEAAKLKEYTRAAMDKLLEKEALKGSAVWSAAIHYNTDNIHVHIAATEPLPTRPIKVIGGREEYKGRFKQSSIDAAKSAAVNRILDQKRENQMIRCV